MCVCNAGQAELTAKNKPALHIRLKAVRTVSGSLSHSHTARVSPGARELTGRLPGVCQCRYGKTRRRHLKWRQRLTCLLASQLAASTTTTTLSSIN